MAKRLIVVFVLIMVACLFFEPGPNLSGQAQEQRASFEDFEQKARGQTVYWNAWGGDDRINAYISWVSARLAEDHDINLIHVKVDDTANVVSSVLADKTAGRDDGGKVDLIWINGENFAAMKQNGLLYGPFVDLLPNSEFVDWEGKPTTATDFTVPTDGLEAPWGMAQFNLIWDTARVPDPPQTVAAILAWSEENPGRLSYPRPPDFIGSTFLKQILINTVDSPGHLQLPVEKSKFETVTASLWAYLDALHPQLWRGGREFPLNGPAQRQLLDDGALDIMMSFYPSEVGSLITSGRLPETARSFGLKSGTIGNTHFIAIPYNASAREGALVVANFLLSAEAQAKKQDRKFWGDETVLDIKAMNKEDRAYFEALEDGSVLDIGPVLPEPHPSWMVEIEKVWRERYSN